MKTWILVIAIYVGSSVFHSCNDEYMGPSKKAQSVLLEKVDRFKHKIQKECLDDIRLEAERSVDSFLLNRALKNKINKIKNPEVTDRPQRPEIEFPEFNKPSVQ